MRHFFNPEIFLEIARKVKDFRDVNEEGKLRTAIGRAYYAAFLKTREYLKLRGFTFGRRGQHQKVLEFLDDLNQEYLKNQLHTLARSRVNADYYLNVLIDKRICEKGIRISREIIESIEGI